jgi:glycosyltransferase involved in cell wall biosynthesis
MRKMKILMCPEYFIPSIGGGEVWSWQVARHLVKRGHEVDVLTYKHPNRFYNEVIEGVRILRTGRFPISGVQSYFRRAYVQGIGIIAEGLKRDYDLAQVSQTFPLLPASLLSKMKRRPIVAVYHDVYGFGFSLRDKGIVRGIIRGSVEHTTFKLDFDAIIAVSQSTKRKLLSRGVQSEKICVITEGVDLESVDFVEQEKSETPMVIYVGRLVAHKRVEDLLAAFSIVLKTVPSAQLYIVGEGPRGRLLRELSSSLKIHEKVRFTGYVPEHEKLRLMKQAHTLVLPSVMEGFGLVLIEAMACRTPVIAANVGGPKEVVMPGQTGFLVEPFDVDALAEKLCILLTDAKMRERMGEAGRHTVEKFYTWERVVDSILRLYHGVLENSSVRHAVL